MPSKNNFDFYLHHPFDIPTLQQKVEAGDWPSIESIIKRSKPNSLGLQIRTLIQSLCAQTGNLALAKKTHALCEAEGNAPYVGESNAWIMHDHLQASPHITISPALTAALLGHTELAAFFVSIGINIAAKERTTPKKSPSQTGQAAIDKIGSLLGVEPTPYRFTEILSQAFEFPGDCAEQELLKALLEKEEIPMRPFAKYYPRIRDFIANQPHRMSEADLQPVYHWVTGLAQSFIESKTQQHTQRRV